MQGSPPRRSRRRAPKDGGPTLPLVPIVIAVVVLGFVIGAGLSVASRHDGDVVAVATPTVAPTIPPPPARPDPSRTLPMPTDSPTPLASPSSSPSASPSPIPSRSAKPSPKPAPSVVAAVTPSASPSPAVSAEATASPVATALPSERPTGVAPPAPPKPHPTAKPTLAPTAAPAQTATATPPAPAPPTPVAQGAVSSFGRLAASVVRVYLASVQRGDRDSATAELASPPSGALAEDGIVDASTEIRRVDVHGTGDVVTVDVDLHTSAGAYAAQYTVKRSPTGAALITDHSIVKS